MIFITLGTQKFPFTRLLKQVDNLIEQHLINDTVICQTGFTDYYSKNMMCKKFIEREEFQTYLEMCDLVICHAGAGTITSALKKGKKTIIVPRLSQYGEHIDDHQLELSKAFSEKNLAFECIDLNTLIDLIQIIHTHTFNRYVSNTKNIEKYIIEYINNN